MSVSRPSEARPEGRTNCWYMEGKTSCRSAGDLVELVSGKPRRLCAKHANGIRIALKSPNIYRASWGMPLSERKANLELAIEQAKTRLGEVATTSDDDDEDSDDELWWDLSPEERQAYWDSPAGQADSELGRLEAELQYLLDGEEYYHWREEPAVRVHVVTEERRRHRY